MANVNVGAVVLAGFVALGGALIGGLARFFNGGISLNTGPFFKSGKKKQKRKYITNNSYNFILTLISLVFCLSNH